MGDKDAAPASATVMRNGPGMVSGNLPLSRQVPGSGSATGAAPQRSAIRAA